MAFPFAWLARQQMSVPNLVIVSDNLTAAPPAKSILTPVTVQGLPVRSTDLRQLGGEGVIPASHVWPRLLDEGNRLQVQLVDLTPSPPAPKFEPGHYVGIIYAGGLAVQSPLAILHVVLISEKEQAPSL
jgi:hypothetical protein